MKWKYILGAVVVAFLAVAGFYLYRGGGTSAGQPPLQNLTAQNAAEFENEFNAAKGDVRVLLLLSPT